MSNIKYDTTIEKTGFTYTLYNTDIKLKATYGDFELPAWSIENFNTNSIWKARYNLKTNEEYEDLTLEKKELLRKEVFNSWSETIWSIIRQRIGLSVDLIGWDKLDKSQQDNIRLALAQQINNWRINLPYEINNNVSRVSGNLQTTINASAFVIGFDILSQQTKQSITATGLDTYDYTKLLNQCYREDTLLVEVKTNKERISQLEANKVENKLPENLITRVEAVNTFERLGNEYLTKTEADKNYVKSLNLAGLTSGGYFENENKVSDLTTTKSLKNTGSKELKIQTSIDSITYQFLNNNNVERTFTFDNTGFTIDNQTLPTRSGILSSIRNLYYDKAELDIRATNLNEKITSEDEKLKQFLRGETRDLYYDKQNTYSKEEVDTKFYTQDYITANYYNKGEVDTKITAAQTGGQVDLSNYYNKNEADTQFYSQTYINDNYYTKANSDLRLSAITSNVVSKTSTSVQEVRANLTSPKFIITTEPVSNSNNAARMEDIIKEVKRLFVGAITEYDKIAKKEYVNIPTFSNFQSLEGDDEEIIISINNQQILIDASSISSDNLLVYTYTYYNRNSDGNDIQNIQRISLRKVVDKLDFISNTTTNNLGPAGINVNGAPITTIDKVVVRKDSVRELIKSLQNVV